jgi:dipeptidyl aminopeptidase/acylaminoacyl peptidase
MQEDVEDATHWANEQGIADPERTCMVGWSYGGYSALMASIKNPDLYACAISVAGVTDLEDLIDDVEEYRFGATSARKYIRSGFEDKKSMRENSPVRRAKELQVPLFLAHAKEDLNVKFQHYSRMKRALKRNPVQVSYYDVDNDDHGFSIQENRIGLLVEINKFLSTYVRVATRSPDEQK